MIEPTSLGQSRRRRWLPLALMPLIGFELPALVLCVIWMRVLGGETWRSTLVVSAAVVIAFYAIFVLALNTSIPHLF